MRECEPCRVWPCGFCVVSRANYAQQQAAAAAASSAAGVVVLISPTPHRRFGCLVFCCCCRLHHHTPTIIEKQQRACVRRAQTLQSPQKVVAPHTRHTWGRPKNATTAGGGGGGDSGGIGRCVSVMSSLAVRVCCELRVCVLVALRAIVLKIKRASLRSSCVFGTPCCLGVSVWVRSCCVVCVWFVSGFFCCSKTQHIQI